MNRTFHHSLAAISLIGLLILPLAGCNKDSVTVDLSSPKATMRTFMQGMIKGDASAAKKAVSADDQTLDKIGAAAQLMPALVRVANSIKAKFPDSKDAKSINIADMQNEMSGDIDSATETITGDTATLTKAKGGEPVHFKKVNGDWKIDAAASTNILLTDATTDKINDSVKQINQIADDVDSGKIKSADEAGTAMIKATADLDMH